MSTFERIRSLGNGFFGVVWLERDLALDRLCAVKYLTQANQFGDRDAFAEAQAMVMAEHDNVVKIYSADIVDDTPAIRMEYIQGGSIQDRFAGEPLPVLDAISAVEDTCRALEFCHTRGWLHRDIKPANLMQTGSGPVKVSDFGLACGKDQVARAPIGYVTHLPPESIANLGYIDSVAGDIYATGVTLYRLLNGDDLFHGAVGPDADVVALIQKGKLPRRDRFLSHVHDGLRRVVRKAIHVDPDRRYVSASALRHGLEAARPLVSWQIVKTADGEGWDGRSVDGSTMWRARIVPTKRGRHSFRLERRISGGAYRNLSADAADFDQQHEAIVHAVATVGRVATSGR